MSFKWKDEYTPLFLNILKRHECLWNRKNKNYKNKTARENATQSMIFDLNLSGVTQDDIKAKIKTIRTRYASELSKVKASENSGAGLDQMYVPKLFWFKQADSFLRAVCVPRSLLSYLDITKDAEHIIVKEKQYDVDNTEEISFDDKVTLNSPFQEDDNTEHIIIKEENLEEEVNTENVVFNNKVTSAGINLIAQRDININSNIIDKKNNERREYINRNNYVPVYSSTTPSKKQSNQSQMSSIEIAINRLQKTLRRSSENENEFDVFCKSLAIQLKKMPLHRALICQEKLQSVMSQERLYQLHQFHSSSTMHGETDQNNTYTDSNASMSFPTSACTTPSPSLNTYLPNLIPLTQGDQDIYNQK